jgi:DNA ligase-associated metallophosphoesterase
MCIELQGEELRLLWQRGIFWPSQNALLLADLHLGKVTHFRKSGLPLPVRANERDVEDLVDLINQLNPDKIFFLGDLFHSHYNPEWEMFGQIRRHFAHVEFNLVPGNHDILSDYQYARQGITLRSPSFAVGRFVLSHFPRKSEGYNLAGHLHPCFSVRGKARQKETLPCFVMGREGGILPAFGSYTGMSRVRPSGDDRVYIIVEQEVLKAA